jgi:tRNA threonylcarbamoyladenosine biosynthesis protein TsaB
VRILAIETSVSAGLAAVLEGEKLLGETSLSPHERAARFLTPLILKQLASVGWRPQDVQLYAVTCGPGSFTGARVGVTTAKTLAYAVGAEAAGVDTMEAIAVQAFCDGRTFRPDHAMDQCEHVYAVLDAQRRQLFCARFQRLPGDNAQTVEPTRVMDIDHWLTKLQTGDVAAGPGLRCVPGHLTAGIAVVDQSLWIPRAETVGRIAYRSYLKGRRDDVWRLAPRYYRPSAAEEKAPGGGTRSHDE